MVQPPLLAAASAPASAQPYPAQFCPVSSVAAPTATTSLLRCLFAVVVTSVVVAVLLLMLKLLQVAAKKNQICNLFLPINLVTFIKRGINFAFKNPSENAHTHNEEPLCGAKGVQFVRN